MRKLSPLPCACGICFFCKNNYTNGIYHKPEKNSRSVTSKHDKTSQLNRKRKREEGYGCSTKREKMTVQSYCKSCKVKKGKTRKECKTSIKGCITCNVHVCKDCWNEFRHEGESFYVQLRKSHKRK